MAVKLRDVAILLIAFLLAVVLWELFKTLFYLALFLIVVYFLYILLKDVFR